MLPPAEAERLVLAHVPLLPTEDCPLGAAHGRVLRAPIIADRESPPFDRVTMDGFALRAAAVAAGARRFRILGVQAAGRVPLTLDADDACIEIMTGAALPAGADCVVPYEETTTTAPAADESPRLMQLRDDAPPPSVGQCVHRRGSDYAAGAELIPTGTRLSGRTIATLASVGGAHVRVSLLPRIAIVVSGDELVEIDAPYVAPHQLRRSNDHALRAALLQHGLAAAVDRYHVRDLRPEIDATLRHALASHDVVILTGGVSKGKFDHIPAALADLGVTRKLQGVAQRPGKPFWFGLGPRGTPVFALPGNPVSTYTCFHRFVVPALARMAGLAIPAPAPVALAEPITMRMALAWLLPVRLETAPDGRRLAHPMPSNTSGDFAGLVATDGFVELPPGPGTTPAGSVVPYRAWL